MKTQEVIETVYTNLAELAKHSTGKEHALVVEIQEDLDRVGFRQLMRLLEQRGHVIDRHNRLMTGIKRARHVTRTKLNSLEWLVQKLSTDNQTMTEQLRRTLNLQTTAAVAVGEQTPRQKRKERERAATK